MNVVHQWEIVMVVWTNDRRGDEILGLLSAKMTARQQQTDKCKSGLLVLFGTFPKR